MGEILQFLTKPSKTTKELIGKKDNCKIRIVLVLLLLNSLSSILISYFGVQLIDINTQYYIKLFFYNVIYSLLFIGIVWLIGKLFKGKASYLDFLYITYLSQIPAIIVSLLLLIATLIKSDLLISLISFLYIPAAIWFLIIWSKGLSKIEEFSETKVMLTVILGLFAFYFGNLLLSGITGMSVI